MLLFAFAGNLDVLLVARVLQGLATGAALGAIGAGLVDLHPTRGPVANASALMAGTASGSLLSALFVQLLPSPTELVYVVLSGVFLMQAVGAALISRDLGPGRRRPPGAGSEARAAAAGAQRAAGRRADPGRRLVAGWLLRLTRSVAGSAGRRRALDDPRRRRPVPAGRQRLADGAALPPRRGAAPGAVRRAGDHHRARRCCWPVSPRTRCCCSRSASSRPGRASAPAFRAACGRSSTKAEPHQRAGVISLVYVISYLSLGLPAIIAGTLVVHSSLAKVAEELGAAVIVLATLTAAGLAWVLWREGRRDPLCAAV